MEKIPIKLLDFALKGGRLEQVVFDVACSAGVFFERAICSRKRHVETSRREEEMWRVTVRVTISTLPNLPLS